MNRIISLIASCTFAILGSILAGNAVIKGDHGSAAIALALLALFFKLEAELPEFQDILRQQRN
ncbi:hypothetical protein [Achromobacter spanius]|uniref:Uncharacterized protein n=1 Tax=Achromobacter spanius TaxID=217203 RepID=A0AA42LHA6_9BURK|nr:hypothetical protein [Achromobacter spanius]MDH0734773.1 hypothetical protein [Achromobacter spanius]